MKTMKEFLIAFCFLFVFFSCKKEDTSAITNKTNTTTPDELAIFKKVYGVTAEIYKDGDYVVIKTNSLPDHKSPYYKGTQWESTLYAAYNGTNVNWNQNPNKIASANLTFRIPISPKEATSKAATPMGPIGVSLNGVPFFNQYAAGGSPLTNEVNSFDQYYGHPQMQGMYHYHVEPLYLTDTKGKNALIGFLLDGFPVYGPMENGKTITNTDLDLYHGHSHATSEYPNGIYHYHISAEAPYLNGDGFFGVPGTVTQ